LVTALYSKAINKTPTPYFVEFPCPV